MENKLKDYVKGKTHYTPIMNIILNNRSENWYADLGKYITKTIDIEKIPYLSFFVDKLKERKGTYTSIAIHFLTDVLDEKALENMFGKPLLHSEFGEGFDGEYDDENDEYTEPKIKDFYASYFINVGGSDLHIGYDHRGTNIEIKVPNKHQWDETSDEDAKKCFDSLIKLVDLYKEKNEKS